MDNSLISIELIYALPNEQELLSIRVKKGTTVKEAIIESEILKKYPAIDLTENKVGIFSKVTQLHEVLREGDRIEIYRQLIADPKEARKKKALLQKNQMKT